MLLILSYPLPDTDHLELEKSLRTLADKRLLILANISVD